MRDESPQYDTCVITGGDEEVGVRGIMSSADTSRFARAADDQDWDPVMECAVGQDRADGRRNASGRRRRGKRTHGLARRIGYRLARTIGGS